MSAVLDQPAATLRWTTMGEIADVIGGGTPRTSELENFEGGDIPWITPADLSGYTDKFISSGARFITQRGLESSSARVLPAGTVLFTSRAPIGYVAIAANRIATNQGFKSFVLRPGVLPEYVYWWLRGSKRTAESLASGTTFLELSGANAKKLPIPLVDLEEQRRIVAEIEKQFSRLDEAVANLKRVKANLRNLRASTLNATVGGAWPSIQFGSIARETLVGLDRGRGQQRSTGPGHRYVKMNNVSMDGGIEKEGIVFVDASSQEASRFALRSGDILFNTRNSVELVGKSALVPPTLDGALYNNNLMRIRATPEIDPAFLSMQMCAPVFRRQLEKVKRATTSVAAIYLKDLIRLEVIVPPIAEQHRIVAEVDRRLSIIRGVEAEVDANLKRVAGLRSSVLRASFAYPTRGSTR